VLVDTSEPEEIVVSTASVVYGLDEAAVALAPVPETAPYKVVLPTVLVMTLEPEVTVVKTASVV
jgi:hypothetical protein